MTDLAGKVAVVTGAAGGLGSAIVDELVASGATPVLLDVAGERLEEAAQRVADSTGTRPTTLACDVTDAASVVAAAAQLLSVAGGCSVLVNNAAVLERAALEEHPVDIWDRVLAVNLRGYFVCTQAFGRLLLDGGGGSIVNVASRAAVRAGALNGAYCASKAGVLALTRQIAVEWGPRGVRANAVSPTFMETPMTSYISAPEERGRQTALGRVGRTAEIARVITFLASDEASYLNGIDVPVDGGPTR